MKYPVLTVQYSDREVLAANELTAFLDSVTSKPQKQTYYPTYNSGYLEYKFDANTTAAEITRLSFTVDEIVYYGSTGVLNDAIKVFALVDGQVVNQTKLDVKQYGTEMRWQFWSSNDWITPQILEGDPADFNSPYSMSDYYNRTLNTYPYKKNHKIYFYYPPEFTLKGVV
jgi:hypothetical protein